MVPFIHMLWSLPWPCVELRLPLASQIVKGSDPTKLKCKLKYKYKMMNSKTLACEAQCIPVYKWQRIRIWPRTSSGKKLRHFKMSVCCSSWFLIKTIINLIWEYLCGCPSPKNCMCSNINHHKLQCVYQQKGYRLYNLKKKSPLFLESLLWKE